MEAALRSKHGKFVRALALGVFAFSLGACQELQTEKPNLPNRPASATRSTVTGTGGEVGVSHTVQVRLLDKNGFGVVGVTPQITGVDGSGNSVAGISSGGCTKSDGNGNSSCSILSTVAGTYTLKVTSPVAYTGGSITFTQITRSIEFVTQPSSSTTSGTVFAQQPVVRLKDKVGNINASGTETVTVTLTSAGGATLSGTTAVAGVAGTVTFTNLSVDLAGDYTLTATTGSLTAASSSFTITAGAAAKLGFTTQPSSSSPANTAFAQQPVVAVQDAQGNTITSSTCLITLTLSTKANVTDSLLGTVSKTASSGVADFSGLNLRVSTTIGGTGYIITATPQGSCSALTAATTSAFEITRSGVPHQLALTQSPSTAALNETWGTQPIIQVLDIDGVLVGTDNTTIVNVVAGAGSPAGTLAGPSSIQVVNGVATFAGLSVNSTNAAHAGTYNLEFDATNSDTPSHNFDVVTFAQTITSNGLTGTRTLFQVQPTGVSVNQVVPEIKVKIVDDNGFLCFLCTDTVTLGFYFGSGAMAGDTTQAAVDGVATFNDISFNTAGTKQLSASILVGTTDDSYSTVFSVSSFGAASKLAFTQQPASGGSTGTTAWATQPRVAVQDAASNVVVNDNSTQITLTCKQASATCTLIGTTTVQVVNGVATFTDLRTQETGLTNVVLEATASGLITTQSNSFTGNAP